MKILYVQIKVRERKFSNVQFSVFPFISKSAIMLTDNQTIKQLN